MFFDKGGERYRGNFSLASVFQNSQKKDFSGERDHQKL